MNTLTIHKHIIKYILGLLFTLVIANVSCNGPSVKQETKKLVHIDTTKSFKIDSFWVTPKKEIDYNSLGDTYPDTLTLVLCGKYAFYPFGELTDKSQLKSSLLNNFTVRTVIDTTVTDKYELQKLHFKSSKLILFFDHDPEASQHSYIQKGEITDSEVQFKNGVKIGMNIESFYQAFFEYVPLELEHKYSVVKFVSCVDDITHTYTFKNGKLHSVKFTTNTLIKADY